MAGSTSDIARWTGAAGDGAWATSGNWIVQAGTPSTPPTDGEKALFDHRGAGNVEGSDQSATELGELEISGFPGQIGLDGTPLHVDATLVKIRGSNRVSLSGLHPTVRIDSAQRVKLTNGDCENMTISGGEVIIGSDYAVSAGAGESIKVAGGTITINPNANAVVEVDQQGGTVKTYRSSTTYGAKGGTTYALDSAAVTTLNIEGGGRYFWRSSGTHGTVNLKRGEINNLGSSFSGTITTLNMWQATATKNLDMNLATVGTENPIGAPGGSAGLGA